MIHEDGRETWVNARMGDVNGIADALIEFFNERGIPPLLGSFAMMQLIGRTLADDSVGRLPGPVVAEARKTFHEMLDCGLECGPR